MEKRHFYLIGIGGIGMQAVARLLRDAGAKVSGSDMKDFDSRPDLEAEGIEVHIGHEEKYVTDDVTEVVYSIAVPKSNPEITKAQELGWPIRRRLELVGVVMVNKNGIAIACTHEKNTTTTIPAML